MTLRKSSENSDLFFGVFKRAFSLPLIQMIILSITCIATPVYELLLSRGSSEKSLKFIYADYLKFELIDITTTNFVLFILYFTVIFISFLTAIAIFSIFNSKKAVNVYFSLPFKRGRLFDISFLTGCTLLSVSIILPLVGSYIANGIICGFSVNLLISVLYLMINFILLSLIVFSVSSLAIILCGNIIEGIFFAGVFNGVPTVVLVAIASFSHEFLKGCSLHVTSGTDDFVYSYDRLGSLFDTVLFNKLAPFNHLIRNFKNCIFVISDAKDNYYKIADYVCENIEWVKPSFIPFLGWLAAGIVLYLIMRKVFIHKYAENNGFIATNPVCYNILFGSMILFAGSFVSIFSSRGIFTAIVIMMAVVSLIIFILSKTTRLNAKKEFLKLPIYALIPGVMILIFSTGLFGYSTKVPKLDNVKDVTIYTAGAAYNAGSNSRYCFSNMSLFGNCLMINGNYCDEFYHSSDEDDIKNITELMKENFSVNKKDDFVSNTFIGYKFRLKNGKSFIRTYDISSADVIKKLYTDYMPLSSRHVDMEFKETFSENTSDILTCFYSGDFSNTNTLKLKPEQTDSFIKAYSLDTNNLSNDQILFGKRQPLGIVRMYMPYFEDTEENTIKNAENNFNSNSMSDYYNFCFTITPDMTNVIKWMKDNGATTFFENKNIEKYESVSVASTESPEFKRLYSSNLDFGNIQSLSFLGTLRSKTELFEYDADYSIYSEKELTKDEIDYIRSKAYCQFMLDEKGYFVSFAEAGDEGRVTNMFVPKSLLTDEIISKLDK